MKDMTTDEMLCKAAAWCSSAEHCNAEVRQKLAAWGADEEQSDSILQRLEKEKFVDDVRYCRSFVHDKYLYAKWGTLKIAQALRMKHIPDAVVWQSIDETVDRNEYIGILTSLIAAKRRSVKTDDEYALRQKLIRFALQRGFSIDDILQCMD